MKVVVLGAGIVGVTSAYYLADRGYKVEVIERRESSALETSFANGGQLSFSHAEPWANPKVLPKIAKWLFREDAPLIFRFSLDPHMYMWGLKFLANCLPSKSHENALKLLKLGLHSKTCINNVQQRTGIEFDNLKKGILHISGNEEDLLHSKSQAEFQEKYGCPYKVLTHDECVEIEPALAYTKRNLVGGVHYPLDESGDVNKFTTNLTSYIEKELGVKFRYNSEIEDIITEDSEVKGIKLKNGDFIEADIYVMSLGSYSSQISRKIGINIPVYPMKGYSITLPIENSDAAPKVSITDNEFKIVYSRLGDRLRVAGTAEFAGYNTDITKSRVEPIVKAAMNLFPNCGDPQKAVEWTGLRPATPSGYPVIGKSKFKNLYFNTGHGTLGWTLSCGSADILADIVEGKKPKI